MSIDTKALDNAADTFSRSMRALNSMALADLPPGLDQDARDIARIILDHGKDCVGTEYCDMTAPLLESLARLVEAAKAADRLAALEAELARLRTDRDGAAIEADRKRRGAPVAWPLASPEDAGKGWTLDYRFIERVELAARQRTNYTTSMEATEQVLIAAAEILGAPQTAETGLEVESLRQQLAAAQAEIARLQDAQSDVLANLEAPEDMDVISAAHFVAGSLSTAEEALEAAQAEARELRTELARVREDRNRYLHAARCAYGLLWQELADTERVREARRLLLEALPDEERKCGIHYAMQRAGLTEAEIVAALSQPAEQHDPLAVSDHCGECGEPEPECACDERIEDYRPAAQESDQ